MRAPVASMSASIRAAAGAPPLSAMARWNNPLAAGETISSSTLAPPADSPKIVTCFGSPPNAAMLRCTHWSAAI